MNSYRQASLSAAFNEYSRTFFRERVPINDLITILETLIDHALVTKDTDILTETVRQSLSRFITKQYIAADGGIHAMTLDPRFERALIQATESGGAINPEVVSKLMKSLEKAIVNERNRGLQPIILCSTQARRFLKKITERFLFPLVVLSNAELAPSVRLYTTGVLKYED